jgi:GTP-binding protein
LQLELKLIADVVLVGFPERRQIDVDFRHFRRQAEDRRLPFHDARTESRRCRSGDFKTFVVADIPGLIEGASEGAGLGDRFLRHVERTKLILHLVDVSSISGRNPVEDYEILNRELANYNEDLAARPQIVVATKLDALDEPERLENMREKAAADGKDFLEISAVTNQGTKELVAAVAKYLQEIKRTRLI